VSLVGSNPSFHCKRGTLFKGRDAASSARTEHGKQRALPPASPVLAALVRTIAAPATEAQVRAGQGQKRAL